MGVLRVLIHVSDIKCVKVDNWSDASVTPNIKKVRKIGWSDEGLYPPRGGFKGKTAIMSESDVLIKVTKLQKVSESDVYCL